MAARHAMRTLTAVVSAAALIATAGTGAAGAAGAVGAGAVGAGAVGAAAAAPPAPPTTGSEAVALVNPFIGSQGDGNTFPGAVAPFGMAQLSPDTGHYAGYRYTDTKIRGFSMVHISGVGCGLGGDLPVLPTTGVPTSTDYAAYALAFSHDTEKASPGSYEVSLKAPAGPVRAELSATTRTGWQRYTFPATKDATVLVNTGQALHAVTSSEAKVVDDRTIETTVTGNGFCRSTLPYTLHFITRFDRPFSSTGTWAGTTITPGATQTSGEGRQGAWVGFDATTDRDVTAVTALSYVDAAGARKNLAAEGNPTFDATKAAARNAWVARLGQVETTGGPDKDRGPFYSSLYRSLITPSTGSDVDRRYHGWDGRTHTADGPAYYQNFSLWDTYRTQVQLLGLLAPREARDQAVSLLRAGQQGGWAPRWGYGPVETNIMTGDPVTPFLVTAWQYGLLSGYERETYALLKQNADKVPPAGSPANGRIGNPSYIANGYVPYIAGAEGKPGDFDLAHGGSATMEYAVSDCSLASLASALGQKRDAERYEARSGNWRALLDPVTKFPRARDVDGVFAGDPDPALSKGFHEGTAWQYQWLVPQNLPSLIQAIGGKTKANARLDHFFDYDELLVDPQRVTREVWVNGAYDYYGQSRYNPQNEPDLHAPYVYLWTGQPWKTADVVRAATTLFTNGPTGLTGNDDLGTMSAWHVLSSIGIYPAQAGTDKLVIGSPNFTKVTLHLQKPYYSGDVVVDAPASSDANRYVQGVTLAGKTLKNSWFSVDKLRHGATLRVDLGSTPSSWATTPDTAPPSPCEDPGPGGISNLSLGLSVSGPTSLPTSSVAQHVVLTASLVGQARGTVQADVRAAAPQPLTVTPVRKALRLTSNGNPATATVPLDVVIPADTPAGAYPLTVRSRSTSGNVTKTLTLTLVDASCARSGSACPLDITGSLNLDGVATAETRTEGNFDGGGWSFPAGQLPAGGVAVLGTQAFRIPSTAGTATNFVAPTSAVTVPAGGQFCEISLVASARNGDALDVPVTLHYANGDVATSISVSDWAAGSPRFGETDLVRTTGRVAANSDSGTDGLSVHLWGVTVATDPARALVSVTFGPSAQLAVMSISGRHS